MPRSTVLEYLANFERHSGEIAYAQRRGYRIRRFTYGEVLRFANQFAREFEARQISKGDRVLIWAENSAQWIAAFFGCLLRGVIVVPMDRIAAPAFVQRVVTETQARLALCTRDLVPQLAGISTIDIDALPELLAQHSSASYSG